MRSYSMPTEMGWSNYLGVDLNATKNGVEETQYSASEDTGVGTSAETGTSANTTTTDLTALVRIKII